MPRVKTGGRRAGTPNKVTAELREAVAPYVADVLAELFRLATAAKNESVRVSASIALLDRRFGRPGQAIALATESDCPNEVVIRWEDSPR